MKGKHGKIPAIPLLVVGLLVISALYGFFLPLSDKCLILQDLPECTGEEKTILFAESPGLLEPTAIAARYSLSDVKLFKRDSLEIATVFDEILTQKSWFSSASAKTDFMVQKGGVDVKLFIVINDARGGLKVKINGRKVSKLKGEGVHQVSIPLGLLKDKNVVELKSTTPFLPLWVNKHRIGKVSLREEYKITNNRDSRVVEIDQNLDLVNRAILRFNTNCFSDANLSVAVNGEEIFDGRLCNGFEKNIIDLLEEKNDIVFTSEGNYVLEDLSVDIGVKQNSWLTYYFDVPENKLDKLVNLKLWFDKSGKKALTLYLNGDALSVDTVKLEFETTITKYLREGQNSLILIPETELFLKNIEIR